MPEDKIIDEYVAKIRERAAVGLNLGCGNQYIDGLINCDLYNEKADKKLDALDLTEYENESVDLIEAHHLLEHFSYAERGAALKEWYRVLKNDGYIIISCPDMSRFLTFMYTLEKVNWKAIELYLYAGQDTPGQFHKSCYSPDYLTEILKEHDFKAIMILPHFPYRPTPTFGIVARKNGRK